MLVCSECLEPARFDHVKGTHTHNDGEPLCPVVGDEGYEPCQPMDYGF